MKKVLIVVLVLVLLLAGVFFWKGGHHAIVVSNALEEWLDADSADQSLTLQYQCGGFAADSETGQLHPVVEQWELTADTFWTEYGDDEIYGLTAGGITAFLRDGVVYMDTGKAYTLPELSGLKSTARRLVTGLLLYGRIVRNGDTYTLTMETEELNLTASVTLNRTVQSVSVSALVSDQTIHATLTPTAAQKHTIPQTVADAMVRASMEPPMCLSEPMELLMPALENLLPLSGSLKLGIASGVLELSETVELSLSDEKATLSRSGIQVDLELPGDFSHLSPAAMMLLALQNGTFDIQGDTASILLSVPGDTTTGLVETLIPQAADLGITFTESTMTLTIVNSRLTYAAIHADGDVPFLLTTIPLSFSAELTIS